MANDVTNERLWTLDTVAVIKAAGAAVFVRKLVYKPNAIDDDVVIQQYNSAGTAKDAIVLKANHTDVNLVTLDWVGGRELNGFSLSTIDGGVLYAYLGKN